MKRLHVGTLLALVGVFVFVSVFMIYRNKAAKNAALSGVADMFGSGQIMKKSQNSLIIETSAYRVTMNQDAEITGIVNKLTGEIYTEEGIRGQSGGLIGSQNMMFRTCHRKSFNIVSDSEARFSFQFAEGTAYVNVRVNKDTEDLVIAVSGEVTGRGVAGGQVAIHNLSLEHGNLILPSNSGIELSKATLKSQTITWPSSWEWELQMAIFQGQEGGFWIWSTENDFRFKSLEIQKLTDNIFALGLRHYNNAPFSDHVTLKPAEWRLNVYEGNWQVPAEKYRIQLESIYAPELFAASADWLDDISLIVNIPLDVRYLHVLKEKVNPENTLLYIPQWRAYGYDINYPDYTMGEAAKSFIATAKELGFRIMLHTNFNGVSPTHPLYKELEPYIARDPSSGSTMGWYLHTDAPYRHAYINPASNRYREVFVQALRKLYDEYGVDAFHLDASLVNINDRNGLIDGLNYPQGNLQLHRELREAMPNAVFAAEGLNEINFGVSSFAQVRYTPSDTIILRPPVPETAHPITAFVLMPYTRYYGYLGTQHPESIAYIRNMTAYEMKGLIPTFTGNFNHQAYTLQLQDFISPRPFTQLLLVQANFMAQNHAVPDLTLIYDETMLYQYRIDGGIARIEKTDYGVRMYAKGDNDSAENVFIRITGANRVPFGDITIPGWVAYNDDEVFGLDPDKLYAAIGKDYLLIHEEAALQVVEMCEDVAISEMRANEKRFIFKLRGLEDKSGFQMTLYSKVPIRFVSDVEMQLLSDEEGSYVYWVSGKLPGVLAGILESEAVFSDKSVSSEREILLINQPHISGAIADVSGVNERLGLPGRVEYISVVIDDEINNAVFAQPSTDSRTFVDYVITIPEKAGKLTTGFGVQDNRAKATVEFLIEINGKEVLRELASVGEGWKYAEVDLADYQGQTVIISLITTCIEPGITEQIPENGSNAVWIEPRIF